MNNKSIAEDVIMLVLTFLSTALMLFGSFALLANRNEGLAKLTVFVLLSAIAIREWNGYERIKGVKDNENRQR